MKKTILFTSFVLSMTPLLAQEAVNPAPYYELGYSMLNYSDSGSKFTPGAARLVVGVNANSNFGYEGIIGLGLVSSKKTVSGVDYKTSIPSFYGLYGKAFANVGNDVEVFARLGLAGFRREITPSNGTSNKGSGISYGVGAKYAISKDTQISADYMSYYPSKNSVGLSGFTLGAVFSF